jgi:hypothetical protein
MVNFIMSLSGTYKIGDIVRQDTKKTAGKASGNYRVLLPFQMPTRLADGLGLGSALSC